MAGWYPAGRMLPFLAGDPVISDGLVFFAVRLSHYRNLLVILVLLLLAAALVVRLVLASDLLTYRLVASPL